MGVLNIAEPRGDPTVDAASSSGSTSTGSAAPSQTVDIAREFTRALEQFLTGFIPFNYNVKLNWGMLSPMFSTLTGLSTAITALGVVS